VSDDLRGRLAVPPSRAEDLNAILLDPGSEFVEALLATVARYGTPDEINRKADAAGSLPRLLERVTASCPAYLDDLRWLEKERDRGAFVTIEEYRRGVLGAGADGATFDEDRAVTLEVSALQYFPWLVAAAREAIEARSLMPGRFIAVRNMKEQEADGDLPAIAAAMQIIGASYVETLDTKGTDGSNVHLGGPATILGYLFPRDAAALDALAAEAAESRVWAGIHYRSDIVAGRALGRVVAEKVIARARQDGSQ